MDEERLAIALLYFSTNLFFVLWRLQKIYVHILGTYKVIVSMSYGHAFFLLLIFFGLFV